MVENKDLKWTNYYVEFLEQMTETSSKVFSDSANVYNQLVEKLLKVGKEGSRQNLFFQSSEEVKESMKIGRSH